MIPLHVPGSKSRYTFVILQSLKPIFKKLLMAAWLPFGRVDIILEATQWCWAKPRITRLTNLSNIILVTNQIWLKATQVSYSCNLYTDFDRDSKIIFKNAFIILLLMKKKCCLSRTYYERCLFKCLLKIRSYCYVISYMVYLSNMRCLGHLFLTFKNL